MVLSTALSCSDIPVEPTKGGKVSIAHLKALCSGNDYRIMLLYISPSQSLATTVPLIE